MWKLVIEDDEGKQTVVPLTRDEYTLGRKEGNSIRLTERNVSRRHGRLQKKALPAGSATDAPQTAYVLEDLDSYNGVFVNGLRVVRAHDLTHGDLIQIGDYRLVLHDGRLEAQVAGGRTDNLKATLPGYPGARGAQLAERPNRLVMLAGPTPGKEFALDSEWLVIGRAEDAAISIDHNSVSRIHCEVHALGDGRFEIIDKGSSNGVRVNSVQLRRGIIEAGDVIELGDVRFKFVGAGQIFRPGATNAHQLATVGDRTGGILIAQRRRARLLPIAIFAFMVAAGGIGAWVLTRPTSEPIAVVTPESLEQATLAEAQGLCDRGDCETAHEKINAEIAPDSPLRGSSGFRRIEERWADALLARATSEPMLEKRRNLLYRIEKTPSIDPGRRNEATSRLQALDEPEQNTTPQDLPMVDEAGPPDADETLTDGARPTRVSTQAPPRPSSLPPVASAALPPPASPGSDIDHVRQLLLQGSVGQAAARHILEPKVFASRASVEEIQALKAICRGQGDRACVEHCKTLLPATSATATPLRDLPSPSPGPGSPPGSSPLTTSAAGGGRAPATPGGGR